MSASVFSRLAAAAVISTAFFMVDPVDPISGGEAVAGSHGAHVLRKKRSHYGYKRTPSRINPKRSIQRSGVVLGSRHVSQHKYSTVHQRRALIEKRNRRIAIENHHKAHRRAGAYLNSPKFHAKHYDHNRETIVNTPTYPEAGTQVVYGRGIQGCPAHHNCGYRLYENGTGPRLITPGYNSGHLPPQDGLNGPVVITLD